MEVNSQSELQTTAMKAQASVPGPRLLRSYADYRSYLLDWFEQKKISRPGFSYRRFSEVLGLKSPNFMQLVISGQRGISADVADKLCKQIGLKGAERTYFLSLVERDQAKTEEDRRLADKHLLAARKKLVTSHLDEVKQIVVSEWYHLLVRELVFLPNFKMDGDFVSRSLNGLISESEATKSLQLLVEAGFLVKKEDGAWAAQDVAVDTGDYTFTRASMSKHHGDTLVAWGKNLETLNPKEQELGLLHIPIASEKIPELRDRIRKFQDEIIGWLCEEKAPDRVVQLGTYLIPFDKIED
ncbi:MAG: TIGR02147 family protein [Proteobacteria bacterium]|nr:MAG: TIGR02147 family protein [Pseudomonadota bacterium]